MLRTQSEMQCHDIEIDGEKIQGKNCKDFEEQIKFRVIRLKVNVLILLRLNIHSCTVDQSDSSNSHLD